ncbi:MAG: aminomethyl-transferring glycine dehydrogenase subunit GcvPA [Acholeplasmataceae bacterium]
MHKYLPHTKADIKAMLDVIKANSIDDLFNKIPTSLQLKTPYNIPETLADDDLSKHLHQLADQNKQLTIFRGGGAYDHFIPTHIKALITRQEFLSSYTPYQPEVSQGTLQYIFEYQSMICELTGMDVSNASMYDGTTATAEAMFMAFAHTNQKTILVSATVQPKTIEVLRTYAKYRGLSVQIIPEKNGVTDFDYVKAHVENTMGVIVSNPNYYGIIEDYEGYAEVIHEHRGLFIMNACAQSLARLKTPAAYGADIACGELQPLGIPLSFGGAYIGYLASKSALVRKMPGRICGITTDVDGKRAFVLTLQAREQHIRRAKANSNICSNQSLNALAVTIYLSTLGKQGLIEVFDQSLSGAHYLYQALLDTKKFEVVYDQPFYKEFVLKATFDVEAWNQVLLEKGILGPLHLGDQHVMFAVTEKRTKKEIDDLISLVVDAK